MLVSRDRPRIGAPRDRAYAVWTDATLAKQWWGPDGGITHELITGAYLAGKLRWVLSISEGEEITAEGVDRDVQPGKKLAFTGQGPTRHQKTPPRVS